MDDYDNVSHDSDSAFSQGEGVDRAVTFDTKVRGAQSGRPKARQLGESRKIGEAHLQEDRPLRVDPGEIRFEAIEPGVLYVMSFSVRNATKAAQRIRIRAPKSGYFALNYIPTGAVAPGIDVRAEIECQLPVGGTDLLFMDSIVICMGQHTLEVPLAATKPSAIIRFPTLCNLGYVAESQPVSVTVPFENTGQISTSVTFQQPADTRVKLTPAKLDLLPGSKGSVAVSFEARELGPWREFIQVVGPGILNPGVLDVTVQVVDQKLSLLAANNGGILDNVDFGSLFYGESKTVDALLVNTGPQQLSFGVLYDDELGGNPQTEEGSTSSLAVPPLEKLMTISPPQGIIKPFSQVTVKIRFNPVFPTPVKGFASHFQLETKEVKFATRRAMIDCSEMGQRLTLNMTGSASSPSVLVSPTILRFGACAVYDRRDILVTLNNKAASKTAFQFSHLAHFKISVEKGELQPYQSLSVIISFTPSQMGNFKNIIKLSLADGLSVIDLKVLAEADQLGPKQMVGGVDKLPEDFEKSLKFVDPEEIKAMRAAKKEGKKFLSGTAAAPFHPLQDDKTFFSNSSSKLRDEIYGLDASSSSSSKALQETSHVGPWKLRQEHNQTYNQFLQQSHMERLESKRKTAAKRLVARGASDRSDPFGVDMGMERGLEEPELKVPQAGEPLWLNNRVDGAGGGGRSRVSLDENRLIQKKWPSVAATQAEMRDCAAEITLDELALVQASHKTIDFGRVCVGSSSVKSFSVTNDLSQTIMVKVDDFEMESRMSKPDCQIVPAGAVAGFDIFFTSKILGKYKKSFSYKINGNYSYKVSIVAEIVPIELEMNKPELVMDFPEDSLEPSLSQDIFLKNPGNAVADFLWGSSGAFVCKPDKGSINPGQVAIISIIWTPSIDKRNKEELALNVTGGVDKTLSVTGIVKEVKASFDEKKISLGTVAVGVETKLKATIRNVGQNPLVYFVDPFDDKLGVRATNEKGVIPPGETFKLELLVTPKVAMLYDSSLLSVSIRGGKPITVKFTGESVIPALEMKEKSLVMGSVAVGSEFRAPLTLVNKAAIPASLTLDLTNYPDFKPSISEPKSYAEITNEQYDASNNSIVLVKPTGDDGSISPTSLKKLNLWRIKIAPGSTLRGCLVLAPTIHKKYNYKLPLSLQGLEGTKMFAVEVTGEAIPSKLAISSQVVDFGDRVVSRDPMARATYYLEVAFRSLDTSKGFSYEIKDTPDEGEVVAAVEEGMPPLFFISPVRGDLAPMSSAPVRVTFQPQTSGNFSKRLNIYITGQPDTSRPYFTLLCRGSAVFPRMTFSSSNVQLPPVPLGTTSRAAFIIFNNGYSSMKIKHKVSPAITVPIDVTFPDGDEFGVTVDRVKVIVSARLDTPASWGGKLEFLDNDGERFVVNVSGASDNSMMTNYSFVKNYADTYGFLGLDAQPVQFMRKSDIGELRAQDQRRKEQLRKQRALERQGKATGDGSITSGDSRKKKGKELDVIADDAPAVRVDDSIEGIDPDKAIDSTDAAFDHREAALVMKWLNRNICRIPLEEDRFPHCITETFGDVVVDCIEQLSGKKITGIKPGTEGDDAPGSGVPGSRRSDRAETPSVSPANAKLAIVNRLVSKYQTIVNFLVKSGALLSHINPIALLGLDDYLVAQEQELKRVEGNRFTMNVLSDATKSWTANWLQGCQHGWMEILFQCIKVFVLSRVTYNEFTSMPGVHLSVEESGKGDAGDAKGKKGRKKGPSVPAEFCKSNVYSQAESVLLAWLAYHVNHANNLEDPGAVKVSSEARLVGLNKRLCDFSGDLHALFPFLQVIHSHVPEAARHGCPLYGYTMLDKTKESASFGTLVATLENTRMLFEFSEDELVSSGRTLLLLALHLYLNLPTLLPKAKVEFKGPVGLSITKTIELKNPSKKKVSYNVTLQGSNDFSITSKELVLLPESSAGFQISLKARFFEPVTATITFWGVRDAGIAGTTMVFQLVSCMTSRIPVVSTKKSLCLFDMEATQINIVSPFPRDSMIPVRMLHHFAPLSVEDALKGNPVNPKSKGVPTGSVLAGEVNPANRDRDAKVVVDEDKEMEKLFTNPFWSTEDSIQLPAGGSKTLVVNALPFQMGIYTCHIILLDPALGEFCYELVLDVGLPKVSDKVDFAALKDGSTTQRKIQFSSKNTLFEKALTNVTDIRLTNPSKKGKARSVFNSLFASSVADESSGASPFVVDVLSPFFNTAKEIPFISEYLLLGGNASNGRPDTQGNKFKKVQRTSLEVVTPQDVVSPGMNTSIISFSPDKAGAYAARIAVYSKSNKRDLRLIDLAVAVGMPDVKLVLEFKGPARQKVSQDIPVLNESNRDWNLQSNITGRGFAGPKSLTVPKGAQAVYPLTFVGPYAGSFEGTLSLSNKDGEFNDKFDYALFGVAGDPLSEGHLYFNCKARTRQTLSIPLKSIPRPGGGAPKLDKKGQPIVAAITSGPVFEVQTDLPYVTGPAEIEIGNDGAIYEFSVMCPVGGVMSGSITFTDSSGGAMIWYTVDIEVTAPLPESVIEVSSVVRKAVAVEISLENPTNEMLVFQVSTDGEGLLGDPTYSLHANSVSGGSSQFYELIYSPLVNGDFEGRVSFYNERVGEFWYKLHLTAIPAPPTVVETVECMVGGTKIVPVAVENPLGEEVTLIVQSSDMDHFYVPSDQVVLGPYSQSTFPLHFRPSSLTEMAYAEVTLSHPNFGSLKYNVTGKGLLPGVMPTANVFAPLNEIGSYTFVFRNPFSNALPVDIVMTEEGAEEDDGTAKGFNLLLRKKEDIVIPPKMPMQISVGFNPKRLGEYSATVNIRSNIGGRSLLWCFPIVGMAEAGSPQNLEPLQTPCKTSLLRDVEVVLKGLRKTDLLPGDAVTAAEFSLELLVADKSKPLVARSFRAQPIELAVLPETDLVNGSDFVMRYRLLFEPLKTFSANVEMLIESKNRGRWRVQAELEGTEPEPDDVISLTAAVGSSDKVSFRLSNRFLGFSNFQAYFSAKSSHHFSVTPANGALAPYGSDGTTFVVTFAPTVYGLKEV